MFTDIRHRLSRLLADYQPTIRGIEAQSASSQYRQAAVLLAISDDKAEPSLLLTQRAMHLRLHPGEIAFPGGKVDPADTSLLATAKRESFEEVGLIDECFDYLGALDRRITRSGFLVSPFVGLIAESYRFKANPEEVSSIIQVPIVELLNTKRWFWQWENYRGVERFMPRFCHTGYTITGLTALLIVDFINLVFDAGLPSYD